MTLAMFGSLLERLTDDEPDQRKESKDRRPLSAEALKGLVLRDVVSLLNASNLASVQDLSLYPEVERSTVNFGIRDLSGKAASHVDGEAFARHLGKVLGEFEPRLLRESLRIEPAEEREREMRNPKELVFRIEGLLAFQPGPVRFCVRTVVHLEDGEVHVSESSEE